MSSQNDTITTVLNAINDVKKTGFTYESVEPSFYLGGDLGVDSREMLEIWYELEQRMSVRIPDSEKRDLYTLEDVIKLLDSKLEDATV